MTDGFVRAVEAVFMGDARYRNMGLEDMPRMIHAPCAVGRMCVYTLASGGSVAFTWTVPGSARALQEIIDGTYGEEMWYDFGHPDREVSPWIVDMACSPWLPAIEVGRAVQEASVCEGFAREGQKVLFRRSSGIREGRIGWFTARG